MNIDRHFTKTGQDVFSTVEWVGRTSRITQPDGSVVFEMKDARIPAQWSQLATDIMVSKYFRKAGVPQHDAEGNIMRREDGSVITGPERSAKQVIHRLAGCWRHWGESHGYFDSRENAETFYDELTYMLLHQVAAPNSPQWFNTGLNWAYNLSGPAQGHYIVEPQSGEIQQAHDAYTNPQPHACFIQAASDDLVNPGGIMDLWVREARLFKYGSGTGTNFSKLRGAGEPLSGGGSSSGLMSWLKIGDRAAAAIKSGGTTRRAAKMVCLDLDHPDILEFINWKVREELKVAAIVEGQKLLTKDQKEIADRLDLNLDYDFNGEAYSTVSGQNSNNSIRIPDEFFECLDEGKDWQLIQRTDGTIAKSIPSQDLWDNLCFAAWGCADPGVQFDSTINSWHTCPNAGRINASNPCSEYMFIDNTACNLASINLLSFYDQKTQAFDLEGFEHAVRLWTIVLDISVLMAAFPSAEIARLSYEYRTLGLGFANLGAILMRSGIPYDSKAARAISSSISAILTGRSYAVSAEMANELGPFKGFADDRDSMLRVIRNHRRATYGISREEGHYEKLHVKPVPISRQSVELAAEHLTNATEIHDRAMDVWNEALDNGERFGYRNAQVSVVAPTGTIGLLMDCDTTGVEPDFALIKFKKLAGGGYFKIANNSLIPALESLGYDDEQRKEIITYVLGTLNLETNVPEAKGTLADFLKAKGFTDEDLSEVTDRLPTVFHLTFAFNAWSLRDDLIQSLDMNVEAVRNDTSFNLLEQLGLTTEQIEHMNEIICGTQTVEGAPHLKNEHLPVFDCANPCGNKGKRYIAPVGHIKMMASVQPFISGAISKTINMPNHTSVEEIGKAYRLSWELGLKANALYRDGCKLSQPLNTKSETSRSVESLTIDSLDEDDLEDLISAQAEVVQDVGQLADLVTQVESKKDSSKDEKDESKETEENDKPEVPVRTVEKIVERIVERPLRRRLPDTRQSITHKFIVAGHEGYLTVGLYANRMPGELFITMSKEGSTIGGLMDSLGTAISVALQYGVPLESLVGKFSYQRFEPAGITANKDIPFAKSLVDYIFRWLGMEFIPGFRQQNAPNGGNTDRAPIVPDTIEKKKPTKSNTDQPEEPAKKAKRFADTPDDLDETESTPSSRITGEDRIQLGSSRITQSDEDRDPDSDTGPTAMSQSSVSAGIGVGVDDPKTVHDAAVKHGPVARLQADVQSVAAIADRENAQASAVINSRSDTLDRIMASMMGDAPPCNECGNITVRNGACYRCENCGNSMGCS